MSKPQMRSRKVEPAEDQIKYLEDFCTLPEGIKIKKLTPKEIKESIESEFEERYKRIKLKL